MQSLTRLTIIFILLALVAFIQTSALPFEDHSLAAAWYDGSSDCSSDSSDSKDKRDLIARAKKGCSTTTTKATATPTGTSDSSTSSVDQGSVYDGSNISPQMGVTGALLILMGGYLMAFGFKHSRPTLGVCGFISLGFITWVGMINTRPASGFANDAVTSIVVPAAMGVVGAAIFVVLRIFTTCLVGALGGLALAIYILCWREDFVIVQLVPRAAFLATMPVFFAILTIVFKNYLILFATSFVGAYVFFVGIDFLAHTGYLNGIASILDHNSLHYYTYNIDTQVYVLLALTIVLFLAALGWQYMHNRGKSFGVAPAETKEEAPAEAPAEGGE